MIEKWEIVKIYARQQQPGPKLQGHNNTSSFLENKKLAFPPSLELLEALEHLYHSTGLTFL